MAVALHSPVTSASTGTTGGVLSSTLIVFVQFDIHPELLVTFNLSVKELFPLFPEIICTDCEVKLPEIDPLPEISHE